jgi:hypothetical protein
VRFIASIYNSKGIVLEEAGKTERAADSYRRAIRWDRSWSVPWFNLGLLFKRQRNWQESLRHNERAVELNASDEGAWWNLGIAATAMGEWGKARAAWQACGIEIPPGDGPLSVDFGQVPVRLNPSSDAEVVWCKRIDPARAVILNVPLPESGHRCGDLLLHDGSREGSRVLKGVEVPVFNALELLQPSHFGTFILKIDGLNTADADALVDCLSVQHIHAEDWSSNIVPLCQACSEGRVEHDQHHTAEQPHRLIGIAAASEAAVREIVEPFLDSMSGAQLISIDCGLPPLPVQ